MVPTVLQSLSSAHTYLKIFIYLDCFMVLSVSQSQLSSGAMLGYVLFFYYLVSRTDLDSLGYFGV